jgi:hypothetical protein
VKRAAPPVRSPAALTLLTAASLVLCLPGHVLAASQTPPASDPGATVAPSTPATPATSGDPAAPAGAGELSGQAIERFKAKDYDAAARLFEQAYGIDPNPNYLFNIGRVYEEKGDIRSAVTYYQRFVKEPGVDIGSRELAVQRLRVLKAILNETEAPPPTTATPATTTTDPGAAQPTRTGSDNPDPKQSMRLGGYALIGVGGVSLIVGGIFGGLTLAKKGDLDNTMIVEERQSLAHQGKTFAIISDVTLFTGAALLATGVVLAVLARKPRAGAKAGRSALLPSVGRNHAGLTYSLRF